MQKSNVVLLADDCGDTCESLRLLLGYDGFYVEAYPKFKDCLERMRQIEPCCALSTTT